MVTTKKAVSLNCQLATWAGETEIDREDIPPFHSPTSKGTRYVAGEIRKQ